MNLLIIGAPGVGKGTVSRGIVNDYNVVHVSTGDMLRENIANQTEIGKIAEGYMSKGDLVPDNIIHDIILERLSRDDIKRGFLFDGYPRNHAQAVDLDEIIKTLNLKIDKVINLEISDDVLTKRVTGRRVCPNCNEIYHIDSKPSKVSGICDKCGSNLFQRPDDTEESLRNRLNNYHKLTEVIIEYYSNKNLVANVNADNTRENVYADVKKFLEVIK